MGCPTEGQDRQGDPGQGGRVHGHLQQARWEGQVGLQGWRDFHWEAVQDWAAGGREQRQDHPPADHQEAEV